MRTCPRCQGQLPDPTDAMQTRPMCDCEGQSADVASEEGEMPLVGTGDLVGLGYRGSDGAMTCLLCDCEMEWEDCSFCGGDGYFDGYEEDPNWYAPGEDVPCSQCGGRGGEWWCQTKDCKTMTCTRVVSKPNTEVTDAKRSV